MATIEQIEQELALLQDTTVQLSTELDSTYLKYLKFLGQAVSKQLMLASYHICTQGYPERFLNLTFSERQQLQQEIRKLGKQTEDRIGKLQEEPPLPEEEDVDFDEPISEEMSELEEEFGEEIAKELSEYAEKMKALVNSLPEESTPVGALVTKVEDWERAIAQVLQSTSQATNQLLQQHGILPKKLPKKVLEAIVKAEASNEPTSGPPNLLNLLVESQTDDSPAETLTRLIAIHLRLMEIEFADTTLAAGRKQIRNLLLKVGNLQREYRKKQRELAISQAEAAWRTSWFEE